MTTRSYIAEVGEQNATGQSASTRQLPGMHWFMTLW